MLAETHFPTAFTAQIAAITGSVHAQAYNCCLLQNPQAHMHVISKATCTMHLLIKQYEKLDQQTHPNQKCGR
jgi:hypothetical protein